jgi:hypothetical protein
MIMKGIQYVELKDIYILCQMSYLIKIALILSRLPRLIRVEASNTAGRVH